MFGLPAKPCERRKLTLEKSFETALMYHTNRYTFIMSSAAIAQNDLEPGLKTGHSQVRHTWH